MTGGVNSPSLATRLAGRALAGCMRLVWATSRAERYPDQDAAYLDAAAPAIIAMWHGQFMLIPVAKPPLYRARIMVARHGDAEMLAVALAAFDLELIRGAGAGGRKKDRGGREALRAALRSLEEGHNVAMTADVPPGPAREVGAGIVTLARLSGRPILPVATASSRYHALATWSRMTINLPFSRIGFVVGEPVHVARDATADELEAARRAVEASMEAATARAYRMAGADPERATPPSKLRRPVPPGWRLAAYRAAMTLATPFAPLVLRHRLRRGKEDAARLGERLGQPVRSRPTGPLVWAHAASVGETNAILPVLAALASARPDVSLLLTTVTVTSAEIAAARLPRSAMHQYVPLDAPSFVGRFLDHWRPDVAIFTESEIWPTLLLETAARSIPLVLANARMSDRSYRRWRRSPRTAAALLGRFAAILAQNDMLRRRFLELGGRHVELAGNLKIDAPPPPVDTARQTALAAALAGRPHWLAASTHDGEEAIVLDAHGHIAAGRDRLVTIIAPRHPERGPAVAALARAKGLTVARRSLGELPGPDTDVYVADTLGELGTLYATCPIAFVGGSLAQRGGQNPIEAIHHGSAVLAGPSRESFADTYNALDRAGGLVTVGDAAAVAAAVARLLDDPASGVRQRAAASRVVAGLGGALDRTVATILPLLPERVGELQRAS